MGLKPKMPAAQREWNATRPDRSCRMWCSRSSCLRQSGTAPRHQPVLAPFCRGKERRMTAGRGWQVVCMAPTVRNGRSPAAATGVLAERPGGNACADGGSRSSTRACNMNRRPGHTAAFCVLSRSSGSGKHRGPCWLPMCIRMASMSGIPGQLPGLTPRLASWQQSSHLLAP